MSLRWLAPVIELALLLPLSVGTAWTQANARNATTDAHCRRVAHERCLIRVTALVMTATITAINFDAMLELVHALLSGKATNVGETLLLDVINISSSQLCIEPSRASGRSADLR